MTVNQFQQQLEIWPHSKESFMLLRECLETDLMATQLEDYKFSRSMSESGEITFTDGYLVESGDVDINVFEEAYKKKRAGIFQRIGRSISNLFHRFAAFIGRFRNNTESMDFNPGGIIDQFVSTGVPDVVLKGVLAIGGPVVGAKAIKWAQGQFQNQLAKKYQDIYNKSKEGSPLRQVLDVAKNVLPVEFAENSDEMKFECTNHTLTMSDIMAIQQIFATLTKDNGEMADEKSLAYAVQELRKITTADRKQVGVKLGRNDLTKIENALSDISKNAGEFAQKLDVEGSTTAAQLNKLLNDLILAASESIKLYRVADQQRAEFVSTVSGKKFNVKRSSGNASNQQSTSGSGANQSNSSGATGGSGKSLNLPKLPGIFKIRSGSNLLDNPQDAREMDDTMKTMLKRVGLTNPEDFSYVQTYLSSTGQAEDTGVSNTDPSPFECWLLQHDDTGNYIGVIIKVRDSNDNKLKLLSGPYKP